MMMSEELTVPMRKLHVDFNLATASGLCPASPQGERFNVGETIGVYDTDTDVFVAEVLEAGDGGLVLRIHFDKVLADT
jgi:hypothetical protein